MNINEILRKIIDDKYNELGKQNTKYHYLYEKKQ